MIQAEDARYRHEAEECSIRVVRYVSCIIIIDTIILTNYTNDAYYVPQVQLDARRWYPVRSPGRCHMSLSHNNRRRIQYVICITIIDTIIHNIHTNLH
jgi:hypothetical protein